MLVIYTEYNLFCFHFDLILSIQVFRGGGYISIQFNQF